MNMGQPNYVFVRTAVFQAPASRALMNEIRKMLSDSRYQLPAGDLLYGSFRAAFICTLDCLLLAELASDNCEHNSCGFLDRIPLLSRTAPQVQLESLLSTWRKLQENNGNAESILDHCVCHAALEELAAVSLTDDRSVLKSVWSGPRQIETEPDHWLHSKIRCLQISQPERSLPPGCDQMNRITACDLLQRFEFEANLAGNSAELLETVGRWTVNHEVLINSAGLLNDNEQNIIRAFFEEHPRLLS